MKLRRVLVLFLLLIVAGLPIVHALTPVSVLTLNSTTGSNAYAFNWPRYTFYANGYYWAFYIDGTISCGGHVGCLSYITSADGVVWGGATSTGVHAARRTYSVITNGTWIFYARDEATGYLTDCGQKMDFGYGQITGGNSITFSSEVTVFTDASWGESASPVLRLDSTGQAWLGWLLDNSGSCGGSGTERPQVIHSVGETFTSAWTGNTTLSTAQSANWGVDLVSLGGGAMYATYWIDGSFATWKDLHGKEFNSTWGTDQQISATTDLVSPNTGLFATGTTIMAVWLDGNLERLMYANTTFTAPATETWHTPIAIATNAECCASSTNYPIALTASYDSASNNVYLYWFNYTGNHIDRYNGIGSTWSAPVNVISTVSAAVDSSITAFQYSAIVGTAHNIGIAFVDGQSATATLKYAVDTVFTGPGGGGGGPTGSGGGYTGPPSFPTVTVPLATFWQLLFGNIAGIIIFAWILLIVGFIVYRNIGRKKRKRTTLEHQSKPRKHRISV